MSRALEAWLDEGLKAHAQELERDRKADEDRALVAKEREREAFEEFGKQIAGGATKSDDESDKGTGS